MFHNVSWGQVDIYWLSYYLFPEKYMGIKYEKSKELNIFHSFISKVGWVWFFKDICFIADRPLEIHKKGIRLHADSKPALVCRDGYCLWYLNGIKVPKWLVMTPAEQIDPQKALDEKNADVQREIIRKIGYDRILKACNAKTIEEWTCPKTGLKYTMRHMQVGAINRRYLCYEHASMPGIYYAKAVVPEAKNIIQMRAFQTGAMTRNNLANDRVTDEQILSLLPQEVK
jgi:hypothetical protein